MRKRKKMRIFLIGKVYNLKLELKKGTISNYTAEILEEDDTHIKFIDKFRKEFTISKDIIKFSEMVE
jgi:hypothetical protein